MLTGTLYGLLDIVNHLIPVISSYCSGMTYVEHRIDLCRDRKPSHMLRDRLYIT